MSIKKKMMKLKLFRKDLGQTLRISIKRKNGIRHF
nr:MAG TPA: hypothetical protein [Caudoviricetes sp.]